MKRLTPLAEVIAAATLPQSCEQNLCDWQSVFPYNQSQWHCNTCPPIFPPIMPQWILVVLGPTSHSTWTPKALGLFPTPLGPTLLSPPLSWLSHFFYRSPSGSSRSAMQPFKLGCIVPSWMWAPFHGGHNSLHPFPKWHLLSGWHYVASIMYRETTIYSKILYFLSYMCSITLTTYLIPKS